jgi:hypothetical protein
VRNVDRRVQRIGKINDTIIGRNDRALVAVLWRVSIAPRFCHQRRRTARRVYARPLWLVAAVPSHQNVSIERLDRP